jgi:SAM-dependent methyltransferase
MQDNFDKEFFQRTWGDDGYFERFTYGVGYKNVAEICIYPFISINKNALEIGPGGGTFTDLMNGRFNHLTAIDVIKKPKQFGSYSNFTYIELPDQSFDCYGVGSNSIDYCFSYNLFCHLSNEALTQYLKGVHRVLRRGGDFVFMLANFEHTKIHVVRPEKYSLGDNLPMGHFYQDLRTLDLIMDQDKWEAVNNNLLPEHRDIIVHLKKK